MEYASFIKDVGHKKKSINDLARFISTRTDNNPNYSLLFGAGCSISSGVRSATQLAKEWRHEMFVSCAGDKADAAATEDMQRQYLQTHESSWYDIAKEYSCLFEKRFDLQRQRRMFVEAEVSGKTPSIGHAYLTALVEQNYFNTIFTTNFDDILNEAFYAYSSQRPIVCAHDSSINSITVTSKRPKIIKIHGDYLFDDLKSTVRETENLEQNMRSKFVEFARDYGLIVVGYSGGDRSVMDVIGSILRNDEYLKHGLYWCLRRGSDVSEELRKLIWRDRVYFVEIEGFDELFAELFTRFNRGEVLPASASSVVHRPFDIAHRLLSSESAFPTTTGTLKIARERLERRSKRTSLMNLIAGPSPKEDGPVKPLSRDGLEDDEFAILADVQNHIVGGDYELALAKAGESIKTADLKLKLRLLYHIADCHRALGQMDRAINVADEVIKLRPHSASAHIFKADYLQKRADKLACLEQAITVNPHSVAARRRKAAVLYWESLETFGAERLSLFNSAKEELQFGLQCDPSWTNECWSQMFDLMEQVELDKSARKPQLKSIISQLSEQHPLSTRVLGFRERLLDQGASDSDVDQLFEDVATARQRHYPDHEQFFDRLSLEVLAKGKNDQKLDALVNSIKAKPVTLRDEALCRALADVLRQRFAKDDEALEILRSNLDFEFDPDVAEQLIATLCEMQRCPEGASALEKWQRRLSPDRVSRLKAKLMEARGDYAGAHAEVQRRKAETGSDYNNQEHYLLLKMGRLKDAEDQLRVRLQAFNFTPEASVDIVNYELARKLQGARPNAERLNAVLKFTNDATTSAAVYAILDRKPEMLTSIRKALDENRTFRFSCRQWPVFSTFQKDQDFLKAIGGEPQPVSTTVVQLHSSKVQ
jgi:tetratricopeptide (TPR) repeat protein